MAYRCFEVDVADRVAHVRLSRPDELNTLVPELFRELPEIVQGISDAGSARALVLSSTGRHFSAGLDLEVLAGPGLGGGFGEGQPVEAGRAASRMRSLVRVLQEAFTVLERARLPVLAAVQGGVVGGAVDLVTACDLRYASADAFFVVQETNLGLIADLGTLQRLGRLVPDGVAREMAYTGRRLPAQRAYEVGLVQQVYPDAGALLEGVLGTAREIAAQSPLAVWGTKVALTYARDHGVAAGLDQVATWQAGMFSAADLAEAAAARAQQREPVYPDLLPEPRGLDPRA